jgi:hypothetical protein
MKSNSDVKERKKLLNYKKWKKKTIAGKLRHILINISIVFIILQNYFPLIIMYVLIYYINYLFYNEIIIIVSKIY